MRYGLDRHRTSEYNIGDGGGTGPQPEGMDPRRLAPRPGPRPRTEDSRHDKPTSSHRISPAARAARQGPTLHRNQRNCLHVDPRQQHQRLAPHRAIRRTPGVPLRHRHHHRRAAGLLLPRPPSRRQPLQAHRRAGRSRPPTKDRGAAMNHPHHDHVDYFMSRLEELVDQLRSLHSVYAIAAACTGIEAAIDDERVYSTARGQRTLPPPPRTQAVTTISLQPPPPIAENNPQDEP